MDIITGERIQELCDIYIGEQYDFDYNPRISTQIKKHLKLENIPYEYNNPKYVFVYTHRLDKFYYYIDCFINPFVLVTHNSDENVTDKYIKIAEHEKVIKWFAQNVMFEHLKLNILPIGVANSMWNHGNLEVIEQRVLSVNTNYRTNLVYFSFNMTNNTRLSCKEILESKGLQFTEPIEFGEYIRILCNTKFIICPVGNGIDTHRFWEALYSGCIPIVLKNPLTEKLAKNYPVIILNSWEELDVKQLESLQLNISYIREFLKIENIKNNLKSLGLY